MLERQPIQAGVRQVEEQIDSAFQHYERIAKSLSHLGLGSLSRRRIGYAPVRRRRMPGPDWADFLRCVVTHGEYEIHLRSAGLGKLLPAFAAQAFRRKTEVL